MNVDGQYIIAKLADRLDYCGLLKTDSEIINLLRRLDKYEIMQLTSLGDIAEWHNDKLTHSQKR